jgi:hypothetical protein
MVENSIVIYRRDKTPIVRFTVCARYVAQVPFN